jgi:hypothetical protein
VSELINATPKNAWSGVDADERPEEHQARQQEVHVHQDVGRMLRQRRGEQAGEVQRVVAADEQRQRDQRVRQEPGGR